MRKLTMSKERKQNFSDAFALFQLHQTVKWLPDTTLKNYKYNMKNIQNFLDVEKPFSEVVKRDIETMIVAMREA